MAKGTDFTKIAVTKQSARAHDKEKKNTLRRGKCLRCRVIAFNSQNITFQQQQKIMEPVKK